MNAQEAAALCRYVKACCPQQAIDEFTPAAWADLLEDIRFEDAKVAVKSVVSKQPFVSPSEIRAEVRQVRSKRIAEHPPLVPPRDLPEPEERAWLAAARTRVGDGESVPTEFGELVYRPDDIRALVAAAVPRRIEEDASEEESA